MLRHFKKEIEERNNLDPIVQKKNNIPYLVDQHLLDKKNALTGHTEVRYSEDQKKVISEPVKLEQNYRNFDYESPWEGTKYIKEELDNNDKKN